MNKNLLESITRRNGRNIDALGSGDVIGMEGLAENVAYFWDMVGNGEIHFGFEGIAFPGLVRSVIELKDIELKNRFVGWHGQIGKNIHFKRPITDLLKVKLLDSQIMTTDNMMSMTEHFEHLTFINVHEPVFPSLNGTAEKLKEGNKFLFLENDFGLGSCQRTKSAAESLGNNSGTIYDPGHAAREFENFDWTTDYLKLIPFIYDICPTIVHLPIGLAYDSIPRNLPEEFYLQMGKAKREIGFIVEFETQMGGLISSYMRNKFYLKRFVNYVQNSIKPWVKAGLVKPTN